MECESIIKPPRSRTLKSGRVILSPGEDVGKHVTTKREELIIVLKGTATFICEGETFQIAQGQTRYVLPEKQHNVINNTDDILEYIYAVSLFEE